MVMALFMIDGWTTLDLHRICMNCETCCKVAARDARESHNKIDQSQPSSPQRSQVPSVVSLARSRVTLLVLKERRFLIHL